MRRPGFRFTALKWWLCLPVGLPLCGGVAIATLLAGQQPACACGSGSLVGAMVRAQQAVHLETGKFASEAAIAQQLGMNTLSLGNHYQYSVALRAKGKIALAYSIPHQSYFQPQIGPFKGQRQPAYHSTISAITYHRFTNSYPTITCVSTEPSDQPLPAPGYIQGHFICPANATQK